jgi:hypothetical protein
MSAVGNAVEVAFYMRRYPRHMQRSGGSFI